MKGLHFNDVSVMIIDGDYTIEVLNSTGARKMVAVSIRGAIAFTATDKYAVPVLTSCIPMHILKTVISFVE